MSKQMVYEIVVIRPNLPSITVTTSATELSQVMELIAKWEKECKRAGDRIEIRGTVKEIVSAKATEEMVEKIASNIAQFKQNLGLRAYKKASTDGKIVPFRKVSK